MGTAQGCYQDEDRDKESSVIAPEAAYGFYSRYLVTGAVYCFYLRHREQGKVCSVYQQVNTNNNQYPDYYTLRQGATGIFDLAAYITNSRPALVSPEGCQHGC